MHTFMEIVLMSIVLFFVLGGLYFFYKFLVFLSKNVPDKSFLDDE